MKTCFPLLRFALLGAAMAYCCLTQPDTSAIGTVEQGLNSGPKSQIYFEAGDGSERNFLSRGQSYAFSLSPTQAVFSINRQTAVEASAEKNRVGGIEKPARKAAPGLPVTLKMSLIGANARAIGGGLDQLPGKSNYFIGNDPSVWRTGVAHFSRVRYQQVYPGVDLVYYGNERQMEYDFVLRPGADPNQIQLGFDGDGQVSLDQNGELVLTTEAGEIRQPKPVVYQQAGGQRREIAGRYVMRGEDRVAFEIGEYDRSKELVIDPVLIYSTYLGGSDYEYGNGIEVDAAGNAYVTGITYSQDFPGKNAVQPMLRGFGNAFVSKFDSSGKLIYSTYLGGGGEDIGFSITADAAGNAYVAGMTDSNDFPTTTGAVQGSRRGRLDAFVTKLNSDGSALVYSTFLGGSADDVVGGIVADPQGNVYLTGETLSTDFPTHGAFQSNLRGGADAYVTKLNPAGSQFVYSTFLGGAGKEVGYGIAVDGAGNAYVTGIVSSTDFPTRTPAQATLGGRVDAFLTKLNTAGNGLVYSTYFGGSHDDGCFGVGVSGPGEAFITGFTTSANFPTKKPFQAANAGGDDAVIARFDKDGALDFSSYMGGSGDDRGFDLAVDPSGDAYLIGRSESINFPTKDAIQPKLNTSSTTSLATSLTTSLNETRGGETREVTAADIYGRDSIRLRSDSARTANLSSSAVVRDGFVAKINKTGTINYSTFLGGSDEEKVFGIAVDPRGNALVTGLTASGNFPTKGAVQTSLRGVVDAFVAKIADMGNTHSSVSAASYAAASLASQQIAAAFGSELADSTLLANSTPLPTSLAGVTVKVMDSAGTERLAPLFFVSPGQVNFALPDGLANGQAQIAIIKNGVTVSTESKLVEPVSPGLFSAASSGAGIAAAVVLRVKTDGSQRYEAVSRFDSALGRFVPVQIDLGEANSGDQVYLILFGTGLRGRSSLNGVSVSLGGTLMPVFYAGQQGDFVGLDQINIGPVPRAMVGRGDVDVVSIVDGKPANVVKISFK
ncbi:MAG: SBBP repeat-containing protein [Acidobacteriota bacterium]